MRAEASETPYKNENKPSIFLTGVLARRWPLWILPHVCGEAETQALRQASCCQPPHFLSGTAPDEGQPLLEAILTEEDLSPRAESTLGCLFSPKTSDQPSPPLAIEAFQSNCKNYMNPIEELLQQCLYPVFETKTMIL